MNPSGLPPSILHKLEAYAAAPENDVTPAMVQLWEGWAAESVRMWSEGRSRPKRAYVEPDELPERRRLSHKYIRGDGIEIGALNNPLPIADGVRVRYVDHENVETLELLYREVSSFRFVEVDVVDDGERLARFADASLDFVIANHFLEHCQDPLGALAHHARVLREGGILYCAVPDCRRTFDSARVRTPFEHLWRDHHEGPAWSRRDHYRDWSLRVNGRSALEHEAWWRLLDALDNSIHFHVWTPDDVLEIVTELRRRTGLPIEVQEFLVHGNECVLVARRA